VRQDRAVLADDPFFNKMVRILATRCMTQAQYFCTGEYAPAEFVHYGLAAPLYTHFTSPIRRYADVVVHRFLAAAIGIANLPQALMDRPAVKEVSEVINYRHRNAQVRTCVNISRVSRFR
jgi:exosome complex exonuclease DIS3/RRP44